MIEGVYLTYNSDILPTLAHDAAGTMHIYHAPFLPIPGCPFLTLYNFPVPLHTVYIKPSSVVVVDGGMKLILHSTKAMLPVTKNIDASNAGGIELVPVCDLGATHLAWCRK